MGEGLEILFWLAIFGFFALRSAAQAAKRRGTPDTDGTDEASAGVRGGRRSSASEGRKGVLDRFTEFAQELERQIEARQEAARAESGRAETRGSEGAGGRQDDGERTVVIPGRRVFPPSAPRRSAGGAEAAVGREIGVGGRELTETGGIGAFGGDLTEGEEIGALERRPARTARTATRRPRRPKTPLGSIRRGSGGAAGLGRLDRLTPLARAIVLSEILGPPPGLDPAGGEVPGERF